MQKRVGRQAAQLGALLLFNFWIQVGVASSTDPGKVIAGWVEKISLKDQTFIIKAKLDSGAKTSSIHAENVQIFQRDGKKWVRFNLVFKDVDGTLHTIVMERPRVRRVRIKDHDSEPDRRPTVTLEICFDGRYHETEFTLTDRGNFLYPTLLGRKFLVGVAVVDPEHTFLTKATCD